MSAWRIAFLAGPDGVVGSARLTSTVSGLLGTWIPLGPVSRTLIAGITAAPDLPGAAARAGCASMRLLRTSSCFLNNEY